MLCNLSEVTTQHTAALWLLTYADKLTVMTVLPYPEWPLQKWLEDPIERTPAVFAVRKVEDAFHERLALLEVPYSTVNEGCRSSLGFPA